MAANVPGLDLGADCKQTSRENHHESVAFIDHRNMGPSERLPLPWGRPRADADDGGMFCPRNADFVVIKTSLSVRPYVRLLG